MDTKQQPIIMIMQMLCCLLLFSCTDQTKKAHLKNTPLSQMNSAQDLADALLNRPISEAHQLLGPPQFENRHIASWTNAIRCWIKDSIIQDIRFEPNYTGTLPQGVEFGDSETRLT